MAAANAVDGNAATRWWKAVALVGAVGVPDQLARGQPDQEISATTTDAAPSAQP
ncbi:hypothetical protein Psuf_055320 [Phytohabitans suffuscus]|uniref:Uncharacterized protein n=1 Tax=Phytohabitans suffuscus TaxID=624315 RepID=A0A6F8YQ96_9ACTN|nr:hypothetical protein Psuf_055320 [Phytohabitans suffuscus]